MTKEILYSFLTNSGLKNVQIDGGFVSFQDPFCILPAFDTILHYAWIVILVLTAFMLAGWAILYIKNGTNINDIFNNAKTLILIFCVLSVIKPTINFIYGDNLFAKGCEIKQVSLSSVQDLLDMRKNSLSDESNLYESFNVIDSGIPANNK